LKGHGFSRAIINPLHSRLQPLRECRALQHLAFLQAVTKPSLDRSAAQWGDLHLLGTT
jgi:hypothetical protein